MCRTELLRAAAVLALALLAQACSREEPRTVVISGQPRPAPERKQPELAPLPPPVLAPKPGSVPSPDAAPSSAASSDAAALLASRHPLVPVEGIAPSALRDNYEQGRGSRKHEAIDIMAPRGTRVFAVDDGKVARLFQSVPGGITVYQFDPQHQLTYYYAHLDRYAEGLKEGMQLRRGDLIGYVGSTGNAAADGPHLHFAVFRLGPERQWWKGEPINPYAALRAQAKGDSVNPVALQKR
jgi:murein DD-endopeptidase MepM/ murein hydrolase activator NlpD